MSDPTSRADRDPQSRSDGEAGRSRPSGGAAASRNPAGRLRPTDRPRPAARRTGILVNAISALALGYVLLRPVSANEVLYPILGLLGLTSLLAFLFARRQASSEVAAVIWLVLLVSLYGVTLGTGNPGFWQQATVWVAGPLLFSVWVLAADGRLLRTTLYTVAYATIALSILIIIYVAGQVGVLPVALPQWVVQETGAGFALDSQGTAIRLYGLSTLAAAAPMWLVSLLVEEHPFLPPRWVRGVAAILALTAALMGGRNAIVLAAVVIPVGVLLVRLVIRIGGRVHPGVVLGAVGLVICLPILVPVVVADPALQRTWANVSAFFSEDDLQAIRQEQARQLFAAWADSPVLGSGIGATIDGYFRSRDRPWNFELQYHMLLFQFGLVGAALLAVVVLLSLRAIIHAYRAAPDMSPVFVVVMSAAAGMLIANATNPYLQAPGHMWSIWLPLMAANVGLTGAISQPGPSGQRRT